MCLFHKQRINLLHLLGVKVILSCFNQLPLNSTLIFELFIHHSFGERLLFAVVDLIFSFDNPLNFYSTIVSSTSIFVSKALLVTNPLTSGILFSTSPIFVLKKVLVTNLLRYDGTLQFWNKHFFWNICSELLSDG